YLFISNSSKIMELNIDDPESNIEIVQMSNAAGVNHQPIVSYNFDCDSTALYIRANFGNRGFYHIDLENEIYTYSHDTPDIGHIFSVWCIKNYNSVEWEDCQRQVDLDADDSTAPDIDYLIDSLCSYADIGFVDEDISMQNQYPIDSIVVELISPIAGVQIDIPLGNYILTTNGLSRTLNNSGTTTIAHYIAALKSSLVLNQSQVSEIVIGVSAWYDGVAGNRATSVIRYSTALPYAGADIEKVFCDRDEAIVLENLPTTGASEDGVYMDSDFNVITIFEDYEAPAIVNVNYVVSNGVCHDTSHIALIINAIPDINPIDDAVLCDGDSYDIDLTNVLGEIEWKDKDEEPIRTISESGNYIYEVTIAGCTAADTFSIEIGKAPIMEDITEKQCKGEVFEFLNIVYSSAGTYEDTIQTKQGCDSIIYTIVFDYYEEQPLPVDGQYSICEGEEVTINIESGYTGLSIDGMAKNGDVIIENQGIYDISGYDSNGCFEETSIEIIVNPLPSIMTQNLIDTVYSNGIILPVFYSENVVNYEWTPAAGLDCWDCAYPELIDGHDNEYTVIVETENGCLATGKVKVDFKSGWTYIANILSRRPQIVENGYLYLQSSGLINYDMMVYDRWGGQLYHKQNIKSNEKDEGWHPSENIQPGVYVYKIVYQIDGKQEVVLGSVTVL
ncbi:MAG: hypothetical protein V3V14_08180, partial [Saprospiraceae bacterium]